MAKQLNIRSDEAYRLAHELAQRRKVPVTDVVLRALQREATPAPKGAHDLTPEQQARYDALTSNEWRHRAGIIAEGRILTDDDLYDENGLPK